MDRRPLYGGSIQALAMKGGNAGLWFNKFCTRWYEEIKDDEHHWKLSATDKSKDAPSPKQQVLIDCVKQYKYYKEDPQTTASLKRAKARQTKLAKAHDHLLVSVESISPFITGMGNHHAVENGFMWHHTLGLPYLPASSLKGVIKSWCRDWDTSNEEMHKGMPEYEKHQARLEQYFGSSEQQQGKVGGLIFLDALPHTLPGIGVDVMTPHYNKWYSEGGKIDKQKPCSDAIPAGWHSPVPIPFLVVKHIKLDIIVMRQASMRQTDWYNAKQALPDLIINALNVIGAGAKTAVGYGYFQQDLHRALEPEQTDLELEQVQQVMREPTRVKSLSPHEQRYEHDLATMNKSNDPEIVAAIKLLESEEWADCRAEMAGLIQAKMQQTAEKNYQWKTSTGKKSPTKDKAYRNTLRVQKYLKEIA